MRKVSHTIYEYSPDCLRRKKIVTPVVGASSTTNFVWDGQNLLQERDAAGLLLAHYTWAPESWNG